MGRLSFDLALPVDGFSGAAVVRNAGTLLACAAAGDGLALTATGNLTRKIVAEMIPAMTCPGFDVQDALRFCKVVNEPDVVPLHFLRLVVQEARLLRKSKQALVRTERGRLLSRTDKAVELQANLLCATFNRLNLADFDRLPLEGWPQSHWGCCAVVSRRGRE